MNDLEKDMLDEFIWSFKKAGGIVWYSLLNSKAENIVRMYSDASDGFIRACVNAARIFGAPESFTQAMQRIAAARSL